MMLLFLDNIEKKNKKNFKNFKILLKILWKIENMLISSIFHNIFKYMIFQRHQKALLWSEGTNLLGVK